MSTKYPDSHGAVVATLECVCITIPKTGWYVIPGTGKEIYFRAGDQLVLDGPYHGNPQTADTRLK